jgi:lipoprotein-releasing system permease protein
MGLRLFIARRFLFSKKSHSVINIISIISIFSVAVITAALVIILSAINGFEDTIKSMYSQFDPDIKIEAVKGKTFLADDSKVKALSAFDFVKYNCQSIEEICIIKNNDQWVHATIKGVSTDFIAMTQMSKNIDGEPILKMDSAHFLIPGSLIASKLNSYSENNLTPEYLKIYSPLRNKKIKQNNADAFNERTLPVSGVFSISPELDDEYVLASIELVDEMLEYNGEISAIEIGLKPGTDEDMAKDKIQEIFGDKFEVKTRYEQKELIYKTNQTEKLFVFIIMIFVLILAGFNVIAAVTMLVIDKQKDSDTLQILGLTQNNIKKIFFLNGLLINVIGGGIGLIIGIALVLAQYHYHIIPLENAIIDYYPVKLVLGDVLKSFFALMLIAVFSSWFPVWLAMRRRSG